MKKPHRPLCSNVPCTRRATHVVGKTLIALLCPICAGQAFSEDPRLKPKPLEAYGR